MLELESIEKYDHLFDTLENSKGSELGKTHLVTVLMSDYDLKDIVNELGDTLRLWYTLTTQRHSWTLVFHL